MFDLYLCYHFPLSFYNLLKTVQSILNAPLPARLGDVALYSLTVSFNTVYSFSARLDSIPVLHNSHTRADGKSSF